MDSTGFRAWRSRLGYTQAQAARELGISARMVKRYEAGVNTARRDDAGEPADVIIPRAIALACAALEAGLKA